MTRGTKTAYPLCWPDGWTRTLAHFRKANYSWKKGTEAYRRHLWDELRKLGIDEVIISTNKPLRIDGVNFRADAPEPTDAGVAIYFDYDPPALGLKKAMCLACDQYASVEWNLHAIGLTVAAIRTIERCGASDMIERAFRGFTAIAEKAGEFWREVLDIPEGLTVTEDHITTQFREFAKVMHPDRGGDPDAFMKLTQARDAALAHLRRPL
jgi:hypothetical protein